MIQYPVILGLLLFYSVSAWSQLIYIPEKFDAKKAKILVVIHGCMQSAESMALGTGWNRIADNNNMVVIYPQVPAGSNPIGCWSWYERKNQTADSGQLELVKNQIDNVKEKFQLLNSPDVFATGISSGAATVAGLIACYPDLIKSAAIHSGPVYGMASNLIQANLSLNVGPTPANQLTLALRACQPQRYQGNLLVLHGDKDNVVNIRNAEAIAEDFFPEWNNKTVETKTESAHKITEKYMLSKNGKRVSVITIHDLEHAWSGYGKHLPFSDYLGPSSSQNPTKLPFFSETGPSSTELIWGFFAK